MRTSLLSIVVAAAAGCGAKPKPAPAAAPIDNATVHSAPDPGSDAGFETLARAVAVGLGGRIDAWGTAPVADDRRPRRFAVIRSNGYGNDHGGYLVEAAPGADWLVAFIDDGHTETWQSADTVTGSPEPAWKPVGDAAIHHKAGHSGGEELIDFDLEGGVPTAISYGYLGDARDGDQLATTDYAGRHVPLAGIATTDAAIVVRGPSASADELTRGLAPQP